MPSNKLSDIFGISTFGESHGPAIGVLIDSPLPNIDFPSEELLQALQRRNPQLSFTTARNEPDQIEILSGLMDGKTTGMPLCLIVRNLDARSTDYEALKDVFRPGHADFSWFQKYGIYDYRGGGRASGRETLARIIAADHVKSVLGDIDIHITCTQIGELKAMSQKGDAANPWHWPCSQTFPKLMSYLNEIQKSGDSVGGILRVSAHNVPPGLGDPVYEKLSANIAKAMFSIGSIRGIHFGDGLLLAEQTGSQVNDQFINGKLASNHHGGILGGVSTGQDISYDLIIRPVSSIRIPQQSLDRQGQSRQISIQGRHDVCHIPRIIPVIEAMLKLCLADAIQYQKLVSAQSQSLAGFRESLDKLDAELIQVLAHRAEIVKQVKAFKTKQGLPPQDPEREKNIQDQCSALAAKLGLDPHLAKEIIKLSIRISNLC